MQGTWLTYTDALLYCQRFLRGKICILANADIHFDETLAHVRKIDMGPLNLDPARRFGCGCGAARAVLLCVVPCVSAVSEAHKCVRCVCHVRF